VSGTIGVLSGSVSGTIGVLSGSLSASIATTLSSSFAKVQQLANGTLGYNGTFIDGTTVFSPVIGGVDGYFSGKFQVGAAPNPIVLDAQTSTRKIYIGTGTYGNTNTSVYLDSTGKFSLGNKLTWDGSSTLTIQGTLKVADGSDVATSLSGKLATGGAAADVNNNVTTISGGKIRTGLIQSNNFSGTGDGSGFTTAGMSIDLTGGGISAKNFRITAGGDAFFNGAVTATSLTLSAGVKVPNASVDGLGSLALKSSVSATADVTDLGTLATRNTVNATYIDDGSITTGKIDTNAITADKILAGVVTANKITVGDLTGLNAKIGGWSINSSSIFNTNVIIDNTNQRIDFLSGGTVKTRIKSGNADIGSFTTTPITIASGTTTSNQQNGSSISPAPLVVQNSTGGNTAEATFTTPLAANGLPFSITVPYPALSTVGFSTVTNLGNGTSWDWSYYARIDYVIRLNNSSGTAIASGNKILSQGSTGTTIGSTGTVTHPGFAAGTMIIPNVATATTGQVYWIGVAIGSNVQTRINPSSGTPIGNNGSATAGTTGWLATLGDAGLLAVANRAEYATNGAQIGSAEGTYVAFGDAAGSGYVGSFNGNVQVIGVLTAGAISASDIRAKTNIQPISNGIETIKKLNPVKFDWLQHITGNNEFEKGYGFIADDVQNVLPDLVYKRKGYQFDDFKHLEYNSFHAIAIKAIQELVDKVEKLETQISGSI
jgi:hypothetical protein